MDSGGSYHITYKRDYLFDFKMYDSGNLLLSDVRECRVQRTGKVQVQMRDGSSFVLDNVRSTQQCTKSRVAKHLGVGGIKQQNGLVEETNVTLLAKICCFLIQSGLSKVFWAEDTTMSTYLVNRSPSSAIEFKTSIDMLGFFGWLASIKQGMLEPIEAKCIFLGCREGTGSMQVLQGVEFEVEPREDHAFEVEPIRNVDHIVGSQKVQTQDLIYYHSARDREQHSAWELFSYREDSNEAAFAVAEAEKIYTHESLTFNDTVACEVISKWKTRLKEDMDARSDVYVLSNGCKKSSDDIKAKGNVLGMEIVRDQSGNTLRVSQFRFYNEKLVQTLLEGHSILSLEGSIRGECDVEIMINHKVWVDDTRMCQKLRSYDAAHDGFVITEAAYMTLTEATKEVLGVRVFDIKVQQQFGVVRNEDQVSDSGADRYDNADVMMAMSVEELLDWIMDSGGSYHITYRRDYLVYFEEYDSGNILLGDGRECHVWGQ
ncbi:zinc finger, CCHC-type containing protein, partial [Tanacetum coccineum]